MADEQVGSRTASSARLRFVLGDRAVEIAVPAEVPLVDLLPPVLLQFGAETVERGAEHEGWVVQRIGSGPLDEDLTPRQLDLNDGEQIYLRPRADQLAPIDYDDIVAGVGDQVRAHAGNWTAARTRIMLLVGAAAALTAGVPVLALSATGGIAVALAAVTSVFLLVTAGLVARGASDTATGTVLTGVASLYAGTAGLLLNLRSGAEMFSTATLTSASAAAVATLVVGAVVVADAALLFAGALTFAVMLALTGLVGAASGGSAVQAGAVVLVITMIAGLFVPSGAFRLSGLTLPLLPSAPEELSEDITPVPHRLVLDRSRVVIGYTGALSAGLGAAQSVLVVVVGAGGGWASVFVGILTALLLLRARHPSGSLPRWSMLVPAALGVVTLLVGLGGELPPLERLVVLWFPAIAVGVLLLYLLDVMPGRRLRPYWGRAVDLLESVTAIALVPVLLQVLGVYALMRGLV